ncbi:MAG TPA: DedA family protein, partial [Acidimicrobiales bacterium]
VGALLWAVGITILGYYLGNVSFIKDRIELALIGIVVLSVIPMAMEVVKHRREKRSPKTAVSEPAP